MQDAWAICRIFKKANSNAQRALSNSWVSPDLPAANNPTVTSENLTSHYHTSTSNTTTPTCNNNLQHSSITNPTPNFDLPLYKAYNQMAPGAGYTFFGQETADYQLTKCNTDTSSLLFNMSYSMFGDFEKASECLDYKGIQDQYANTCFPIVSSQVQENIGHGGENLMALLKESCPGVIPFDDQLGVNIRSSIGVPYILPLSMSEMWRSSLLCDSSPCPSDQMSASYSTNKCNT
ncbi:hypothetical protein AgCh_028776 [Apium graveolens]